MRTSDILPAYLVGFFLAILMRPPAGLPILDPGIGIRMLAGIR